MGSEGYLEARLQNLVHRPDAAAEELKKMEQDLHEAKAKLELDENVVELTIKVIPYVPKATKNHPIIYLSLHC